jgi:hypothetical protein
MIRSFAKLSFPERPARPSKLTAVKINGPTRPKAALILMAFSTLLLCIKSKAAVSSMNDDMNRIMAIEIKIGSTKIPPHQYWLS